MVRVGFIMRAHPAHEDACLVSGAVKNPFRQLRSLRDRVEVVGVLVTDEPGRSSGHGYPVVGRRVRALRLYARTLVWNVLALPRVMKMFARSDVVQCHHPHLGLGAALARRVSRGAKFVVKAHGTAVPELAANRYTGVKRAVLDVNAWLHRHHDRLVLRVADLCLVSSDHQMAEMTTIYGVDRARLRRVYNGVDPTYVTVRSRRGEDVARAPRLVFVGRVVPKKGFRYLRILFTRLRELLPDATLTLVLGHRDRIEDEATYNFVTEQLAALPGCHVRFDLSEPDLYDLLSDSDIGVVPSEGYESIPTVVLEMCAAGLPVFATGRWGIPEVLPERFALTGDADVDVQRLAEFVMSELATWDSAGWAREYERFRYDRLAHEYCAIYEELVGHDGR